MTPLKKSKHVAHQQSPGVFEPGSDWEIETINILPKKKRMIESKFTITKVVAPICNHEDW